MGTRPFLLQLFAVGIARLLNLIQFAAVYYTKSVKTIPGLDHNLDLFK